MSRGSNARFYHDDCALLEARSPIRPFPCLFVVLETLADDVEDERASGHVHALRVVQEYRHRDSRDRPVEVRKVDLQLAGEVHLPLR